MVVCICVCVCVCLPLSIVVITAKQCQSAAAVFSLNKGRSRPAVAKNSLRIIPQRNRRPFTADLTRDAAPAPQLTLKHRNATITVARACFYCQYEYNIDAVSR